MKSNKSLLIAACGLTLLLAACGNSGADKKQKNGLSTSLINNPRTADGTTAAAMADMPTMDFADTSHDFGTMHEGEMSDYDFHFTNHGKQPLLIASAVGSCGCTASDYPHEPVAPGKSGIIHVRFNSAGKFGHQNKSVSIQTNSNKGLHLLTITTEVIADPNKDKQ